MMQEVYEPLYKRTTTGAVQIWYQVRISDKFRTVSGQVDGAHVTSEWTTCKGKNIGKANETTGEEQAIKEVEANYTKKRKSHYKDNIEDIDTKTKFDPMLAKDYNDYKPGYADYKALAVYSQPKLDGIRCIAKADGLWSREGNPIYAVPHIFEALKPHFEKNPGAIFDGELYNHDLKDDFNKIVSLVRKQTPDASQLEETKQLVQYHVYDMPSYDGKFVQRNHHLVEFCMGLPEESPIILVPTTLVASQEILDKLYETYLEQGYEGQMVRINATTYENKRTKYLLKRKEFLEDEFPIVEIVEGIGNRSGMAGFARLKLPDGRTFKANIKGDRAFLRSVLERRTELAGKECTLIYFTPTPDGIPRFGRVKAIHETKRW